LLANRKSAGAYHLGELSSATTQKRCGGNSSL
jgi:hypothetical protein